MDKKQYDYLIVGAGLFGAGFAFEAKKKGKKCLVIDRRNHIGGNIYSYEEKGIQVHKYGAHIFHTNNERVWKYINEFASFNHYVNAPIAIYKDKVYNLPFNMNTFNRLWGVTTPKEAEKIIQKQVEEANISNPKNLEEQGISMVGKDIYEILIKGYTEKQWGKPCCDLPSSIIKRLPVRFTYDNNYFNHPYQGIPIGGYAKIIEKMLWDIEVRLERDYFEDRDYYNSLADKIVYTGMIDRFYDYRFGVLEYRSLKFETENISTDNYQGNAVVNYTSDDVPYTRIIEHKHFEFGIQKETIITKEYPLDWEKGVEPYYPINDEKNSRIYEKYLELAKEEEKIIFGGRLAEYKYYNMDEVLESMIEASKNI